MSPSESLRSIIKRSSRPVVLESCPPARTPATGIDPPAGLCWRSTCRAGVDQVAQVVLALLHLPGWYRATRRAVIGGKAPPAGLCWLLWLILANCQAGKTGKQYGEGWRAGLGWRDGLAGKLAGAGWLTGWLIGWLEDVTNDMLKR